MERCDHTTHIPIFPPDVDPDPCGPNSQSSKAASRIDRIMGLPLKMDNLHAPTIPSGPTNAPVKDGRTIQRTMAELQQKKANMEAELRALGGVLDSVSRQREVQRELEGELKV